MRTRVPGLWTGMVTMRPLDGPRAARVVPGSLRLLLLACVLGASGLNAAVQGGGAAPSVRLESVGARIGENNVTVLIQTSDPAAYVMMHPDPQTVLVDLRRVNVSGFVNRFSPAGQDAVSAVTVEQITASDGVPVARVKVALARALECQVRSERNTILVEVDLGSTGLGTPRPPATEKPQQAAGASQGPQQAAAPATPAPQNAAAAKPATRLTSIKWLPDAHRPAVLLVGNGQVTPTYVELTKEPPPRLVVDLAGVSPAVPAVTNIGDELVRRIRVATHSLRPLVTRVVLDLTRVAGYRLEPSGSDLKVTLERGPGAGLGEQPMAEPAATTGSDVESAATSGTDRNGDWPQTPAPASAPGGAQAAPVREQPAEQPASAASQAAGAQAARVPEQPAEQPASAAAQAAGGQATGSNQTTPQQGQAAQSGPADPVPVLRGGQQVLQKGSEPRQYTGTPISLDFAGTDIRTVLRAFVDYSGLNIIVDPQVKGTVDIALRDVPWDQAMEIILKSAGLGYTIEGNVVRIAPLTLLADEETQRRKLAEERALGGELDTLSRTLSYATAEDMKGILERSVLTKRGQVEVDKRTNTLIVRDLPSSMPAIRNVIDSLDKPQPQVEIEARVVQTTRNFARQIGVQWGFLGRVDPSLGNTTGLSFPNQGSIGGRTGATSPDGVPSGVNLPVPGATSAIGLAMGSMNGSFNLDIALSALEKSGQGHLLSAPRVLAQNNVESEMTQGVEVPIQTIANNTVTVQFKPAALTLRVTPQITADNTVILNLSVENASPDYTNAVNNIPPINTQRAKTQVMVKDNETIVIGGIYVSREQSQQERTPGLHRIPLLGWLFKRDSVDDETNELLIFITPRILGN